MGLFDVFKKKEDKVILDDVPEAKIFECFKDFLPKKWKKFAMYYITSGNMMTYKFWVDCGKGYIDCYNLKGFDKDNRKALDNKLIPTIISSRSNLPKEKQWSMFSMIVTNDGKIHVDYNYENMEETYFLHQQRWEDEVIKGIKIDVQLLEQQMDQNIFNILQKYLPKNWQEVIFFAGYYQEIDAYFKYWVKLPEGNYIDCFNLIPEPKPGKKDILQEQLMLLHREISEVRRHLILNKKDWVCFEMSVSSQGKMTKNYDYADGVSKQKLQKYVEDYKDKLNKKYS